ncbi:hypothetical protein FKM82_022541 [Ascaphus truei]
MPVRYKIGGNTGHVCVRYYHYLPRSAGSASVRAGSAETGGGGRGGQAGALCECLCSLSLIGGAESQSEDSGGGAHTPAAQRSLCPSWQ